MLLIKSRKWVSNCDILSTNNKSVQETKELGHVMRYTNRQMAIFSLLDWCSSANRHFLYCMCVCVSYKTTWVNYFLFLIAIFYTDAQQRIKSNFTAICMSLSILNKQAWSSFNSKYFHILCLSLHTTSLLSKNFSNLLKSFAYKECN